MFGADPAGRQGRAGTGRAGRAANAKRKSDTRKSERSYRYQDQEPGLAT